ncbi:MULTISPECIES: DNA polymerase III subunit gamma/tau [unclassified Rathayibacter]|uniref:DNA polymerase III subunit gamma/tau n=1 Tax=unclassified Rathayibacter TaxID=2609250 RepID=UPI000CE72B77|nr:MULTISPECIES: DNA polymerase III subunit gamma/tau [unclassified Rathayibacter]PPF28717.1 DNA polymerase III subunit gamma/tau [Rathayibacter sp. AY1F2]PPG52932.1 DNA polymerase III subunit gamma/tau [Rathayibacter sp. AY1E9]PPG59821.1 DNA polymerase III subunit gamma/tau [Rathayibacter sp. AY1C5]PPH47153.1 DNA polymerase III subunit gamma/tau [Rathayibacter sp. AY1F7]
MIDGGPGRSPEDDDAATPPADRGPDAVPEDDADDEALEWAGEGADPTLAAGTARVRRTPRTVAGAGPADDGSDDDDSEVEDPDDEAASSSALLIAAGIAAGLYLLYAIAWAITATRQSPVAAAGFAGDALGGALYSLGLWLAVLAPPVWFAVVLLATRDSRVRTRVLWLVAGLVLLAPLPFLKGA